jgi:hypothetical protein
MVAASIFRLFNQGTQGFQCAGHCCSTRARWRMFVRHDNLSGFVRQYYGVYSQTRHVCFTAKSGHGRMTTAGPLSAKRRQTASQQLTAYSIT